MQYITTKILIITSIWYGRGCGIELQAEGKGRAAYLYTKGEQLRMIEIIILTGLLIAKFYINHYKALALYFQQSYNNILKQVSSPLLHIFDH